MLLNHDTLKSLLNMLGVSVDLWGKGEYKGLDDLLEEIEQGESFLKIDGNGIARTVEIVKLFVCDEDHPERGSLFELKQILPDGRVRERMQCPSEKIKSGETPKAAAIRGVKEELHISFTGYRLFGTPLTIENTVSKSYPNLPCSYVIHNFKVILNHGSPALRERFTIAEGNGTTNFFGWEHPKRF